MATIFKIIQTRYIQTEKEVTKDYLQKLVDYALEQELSSSQELYDNDSEEGVNFDVKDGSNEVIDVDAEVDKAISELPIEVDDIKLEKKLVLDEFLNTLDGPLLEKYGVTLSQTDWTNGGVKLYITHKRIGVPIEAFLPLPSDSKTILSHIEDRIKNSPELATT